MLSRIVSSLALALSLVAAGCGTKVESFTCVPACPTGFHCTSGGCIVDSAGPAPDLSATTTDLGGGCDPACGGATPFCDKGACVACVNDGGCPGGQVCRALGLVKLCVPGCIDDARCAGLPGGAAVHCCGGACVDTSSDPSNCGACGTACGAAHAAAACVNSACATSTCKAGFGDCNHDASDGCEVNLTLDAQNCGACGGACHADHATTACSTACYIQSCAFGWGDCNQSLGDGCEMNVLSDPKNCGGCGNACDTAPHATVGCQSGTCRLSACVNGYADCDGDVNNGCEVPVASDASNCGGCGTVCAPMQICKGGGCTCKQCNIPNAKTKCINGLDCVFDKCLPGWGDCNNSLKDGCEYDVTTDENNCGACGNVCTPDVPHCVAGVCSLEPVMVGKFQVDNGPDWGGNPTTYSCLEACAKIFGGDPVDYACSTRMDMIDHQSQSSIYAVGGCHVVAEDFKMNVNYSNAGGQSSYVRDNCQGGAGTNYCFM